MLRELRETDLGFVRDSWLRSFGTSALAASVGPSVYRAEYMPLIGSLTTAARVLIDADEKNDDVILGWVAHQGTTLHYVFVRDMVRGEGRASRLLAAVGLTDTYDYTHRTTDWQRITSRWGGRKRLSYNPFKAWRHDVRPQEQGRILNLTTLRQAG